MEKLLYIYRCPPFSLDVMFWASNSSSVGAVAQGGQETEAFRSSLGNQKELFWAMFITFCRPRSLRRLAASVEGNFSDVLDRLK